jgi:gas vesicle protein
MLFAPKRGPDARRRITYKLEQFTAQAEGFLRGLVQSSIEQGERRNSDAVVEDAEARADHIRDDIDALMEELQQAKDAGQTN